MSLGGRLATARGVEIKDLVFYLSAAVMLGLLAIKAASAALAPAAGAKIPVALSLLNRADPARGAQRSQAWLWAQAGYLAWVGISLASMLWSTDPALTFGQAAIYGLGVAWALGLAWTLGAGQARALIAGYLICAAAGAALCVWFYYERNPFHRPGFPLGNPNILAAAVVAAIVPTFSLILAAIGWLRGPHKAGAAGLIALLAGVALLVPLLWCWRLTGGRGASLGLVVAVIVVVYLCAGRVLRRVLVIIGGTGVTLLMLFFYFYSRFDLTMARGDTIRLRLYAWRYAAALWQESPFRGVSAGGFPRFSSQFAHSDRTLDPAAFMSEIVEHAHNELFEVLAEIGLVGGVTLVAAIVATWLAGAWLVRTAPTPPQRWLYAGALGALVALWVDALFGVSLRLPGVPAIYYTLLGALWALCRARAQEIEADAAPLPGAQPAAAAAAATPVDSAIDPIHASSTADLSAQALPWRARALAGGAALAAAALCPLAGYLGWQNWMGALEDHAGAVDLTGYRWAEAAGHFAAAEPLLLEPVQRLRVRHSRIRSQLGAAGAGLSEFGRAARDAGLLGRPTSQPASDGATSRPLVLPDVLAQQDKVAQAALEAFQLALDLNRRAPLFSSTEALTASAAEILAATYRPTDPPTADEWRKAAWAAWLRQRRTMPYDVDALLALRRYPGELTYHVGLLRDALRMGDAKGEWLRSLQELMQRPGFDDALTPFRAAADTVAPDTNVDSLVLSMAPETLRLSAAVRRARGAYKLAADEAARAARLTRPGAMRSRFPKLYSVALAEQAEYLLLAAPAQPDAAITLLNEALAALPVIQAQKYEELVRPFRELLLMCLLAADREREARDVLAAARMNEAETRTQLVTSYTGLIDTLRREPQVRDAPYERLARAAIALDPTAVGPWSQWAWVETQRGGAAAAQQVLREARSAGVRHEQVERIRRSLILEFPALAEELREARP